MAKSEHLRRHKLGLLAEFLAAIWLRCKGYKIHERRYKTRHGEIDLIVERNRTVSFVEVKARNTLRGGKEAITEKAKKRITQTALLYLQREPVMREYECRFDVIVMLNGLWPKHIKDAWRDR